MSMIELTPDLSARLQRLVDGLDTLDDARAVARDLLAHSAFAPAANPAHTNGESHTATPLSPRIAGLGRGDILYISEDFDDELPDAFWGDLFTADWGSQSCTDCS